ncbi:putative pentatricopeptide repeat-containing protein At3g23330 [Cryptomeria japonica]|uniref:putative pentatricopeptide repeat-containing protein At3g23330 n=1 Tax=Cryptomeria japonica TaxID=3369 RepID=UPI0027DA9D64|nr:putative pentatricopeptide repeat-containing protein At3g23330 [Cryptomeria japonica]
MLMPSTANLNLNFTALYRDGLLKEALHILFTAHNPPVEPSIYIQLLQTCITKDALSDGKRIHSLISHRVFEFAKNPIFQNKLINMYVQCGSLVNARKVFDGMKERDGFSWNVIIAAYRRHGNAHQALRMFHQMQGTGVKPDQFTFASILPACAKIRSLEQGINIHQSIMERGFLSDVVIANALLDMYAKCGSIHKARELFVKMPQKDVVSWNTMITGYAQIGALGEAIRLFEEMPRPDVISWNAMVAGYARSGFVEKALEAFKQMQSAGLKPNSATFASILPGCAKVGALEWGMDIHQSIVESGFMSDFVVASALVDMYAKCGNIHKASSLFDKMPQRDSVSWTAMIAGYTQNGFYEKALETYKQMQLAGVKPESTTFASILPACGKMGALEQGIDIHQNIIECGCSSDIEVVNSLIDMYAKCGSVHKAREIFDKMPQRDVVSWTATVAGYAQNGFFNDALELFELMKHSGTHPDHVCFTRVLFACSHAGLVDEGCKYFNAMSNHYCITPRIDHYVCMADLLGRAGYLDETFNFLIKMPNKPVVDAWMCLLGACRSHKNLGLGVYTANLLFELDPKNSSTYVLLSNLYTEMGELGEVQMVRRLMQDRGVKKLPGCSWIEGHKMVHVFCAGDRSHPQTQEIYVMLEKLSSEMKAAGYVSDLKHALNDVEEEEKELFLCHHSEKLAIAYGLINSPPGTTIRVVKNLRVCVDCHTATKFISKIVARQIIVRDGNRFHHFKQGHCSCGDFW